MRPVLALDLSNYQRVPTAADIACWRAGGVGFVWVRGSLERQAMIVIARQQLAALVGQIPTGLYEWGYGDADPAATATQTEQAYGDLVTTPWRFADIEDVPTFKAMLERSRALTGGVGLGAIPPRLRYVDESRPSLLSLGQTAAVAWIASWEAAVSNAANPGIYTAPWAWRPITGNTTQFAHLPLWLAQPDQIADLSVFTAFADWRTIVAKQFTFGASFCGESVDESVADADTLLPIVVTPAPPPLPITAYETSIRSVYNRLTALLPLLDGTLGSSIEDLTYPGLTVAAEPQQVLSPPAPPPPVAVLTPAPVPLPDPGAPGFWRLLSEVLVFNLLDVINWATFGPVILAFLLYLSGHIASGQAFDAAMILGAINAALQGLKEFSGHGNIARAQARAESKAWAQARALQAARDRATIPIRVWEKQESG